MEFKRTELEITIYGEKCVMRLPTVKEFQDYAVKAKEVKDDADSFEMTNSFLEKLGLKKGLANDLEVAHLQNIIEAISGQKKS